MPTLLSAALNDQDLDNIGVVIDANQVGVESRYRTLKEVIRKYDPDIELPQLDESGVTINYSTDRKIGIWIMPDNQSKGYLEHFLEKLIPAGSKERYAKVKTLVKDHNKEYDSLIPEKAIQKANIYVYLALQKQPGKPLGQAIKANYFDAESVSADDFVNWMKATFEF